MKRLCVIFSLLVCTTPFLTSCVEETQYADDPKGNFEALWRIVDEHYCFFTYKQNAYGLDWNECRQRYGQQINEHMTDAQLFEVLTHMLAELRDGHVNLYSKFDVGRYWSWYEDYPTNYSENLIDRYLGTDYKIASGMRYRILDDNIGYVSCTSFENGISASGLDNILYYLSTTNGLIIDLRNNSGGMLTSAEELAARFTNEEILVGYMQHKTGKGHDDFSAMEEQWLKPSSGLRWQKQVVVLTNRRVYSAANEFVKYMKRCPLVTVVGDRTGGGAGMPFSSELPNGWGVRFSACPMYDVNHEPTEFGIAPDIETSLNESDAIAGKDSMIEFARTLLNQ